ncbi:MAG: inositol monophosphatase [Trueperaceae bacterium]|nr:inositol monophosphatase [Trueperaceae bacterium]
MSDFLKIALEAGHAAMTLLNDSDTSELTIKSKTSHRDIVTQFDIASEAKIREILAKAFPEHSILGEEGGQVGNSPYRWILDPIDGTSNFARGIPHYSVSIGLEKEGEGEVGVIMNPSLKDAYSAQKGSGAFKNGQAIRVSEGSELLRAFVTMSFGSKPEDVKQASATWTKVLAGCQTLRRMGSTALELALLAEGKIDAFIGYSQSPWDVAAGMVLVREAGGVAFFDEPKKLCIAASNTFIFEELNTLI